MTPDDEFWLGVYGPYGEKSARIHEHLRYIIDLHYGPDAVVETLIRERPDTVRLKIGHILGCDRCYASYRDEAGLPPEATP